VRFSTLEEWLSWQENFHHTEIDLGLDRLQRVFGSLFAGKQAHKPITLTVGGTNGKGSCIAVMQSILQAAGYKVGTYTSPHLLVYNERICVDGRPVPDEWICHSFQRIDQSRQDISLTYFEFGTLAALDIFEREKVDIQLLEVGLGGRLDAVNIVEPDLAVVTNVALDHQAFLGNTREAIGREKAGIFRPNIPLLVGESSPPQSLLDRVDEIENADLKVFGKDFGCELGSQAETLNWWGCKEGGIRSDFAELPYTGLPLPSLACGLQALLSLNLVKERSDIVDGLQGAQLQGRYQKLFKQGIELILDVGHNPAAAEYLLERLKGESLSGLRCVFSSMQDKHYTEVVQILAPLVKGWYLAPLGLPRGAIVEDLHQSVDKVRGKAQVFDTIGSALQAAVADSESGEKVLVCGSFITVAESLVHCKETENSD